jgi:hypothetical protein
MYGSLVVGSEIGYTIAGWYHGGINIRGLGVNHPKDATSGLKDGSLSGPPLSELPPGCPQSNGW